MSAKKILAIVISVLLIAGIVGFMVYEINFATKAGEIPKSDAQELVNKAFDDMAIAKSVKIIAEKNKITVNNVSYGDEKNIILECSVDTVDAYSVISAGYDKYLGTDVKKKNGTMFKSALDFKLDFENEFVKLLESAPAVSRDCRIEIYETESGLVVYSDKEAVNAVYGNILDIEKDVSARTTYTDASGVEHKILSGNVNKGIVQCFELRHSPDKPDTSNRFGRTWNSLKDQFNRNFIEYGRWKTIFAGLWVTLKLTLFALIIGIIIGFVVAFVRCTYLKNAKHSILLKILNAISQVYLTVIRGTPAMVQIMIIYFVIFMPMGVDKFVAAVVCFGLNSGAYVAEIVRGGIMSVDDGQTEAGRSLGFGYMPTMYYIVFPQAFKAVLPSLANEFVVLLKETSIAFYIGLGDLMYAVNGIRAATYSQFMPLIAAALIYLVLVLALSKLVSLLERRLRNNER